jgi:hypothetical protein
LAAGCADERFGEVTRDRYGLLLAQAVIDLAENPGRHGAQVVEGRIHYHIRHSRSRVPKADRIAEPRHLVIARVVGDGLWVLAYAHDGMDEALERRIRRGESEL